MSVEYVEPAVEPATTTTTKTRRKKKKSKKVKLRNTRLPGRRTSNKKLNEVLKPTEDDILKLLAAKVHVGRTRAHVNMKRYIWKRRPDGIHIINLEKTWYKLVLAARIIAAVQNPSDVVVLSTRTYGQRAAIKYATYTAATPHVGNWVNGTFTNPQNKEYSEPRLVIVDDPVSCFAGLVETSYIGIPVISFCGTDNNTRFVDCAIPCNNRGKYSIGLLFWLLAREVLRIRGDHPRDVEWPHSVDLFFYRDPDEIEAQQLKQEKKRQEQANNGAAPEDYYNEDYNPPEQPSYGTDLYDQQQYGAATGLAVNEEWANQPPEVSAEWGYGGQADQYYGSGYDNQYMYQQDGQQLQGQQQGVPLQQGMAQQGMDPQGMPQQVPQQQEYDPTVQYNDGRVVQDW